MNLAPIYFRNKTSSVRVMRGTDSSGRVRCVTFAELSIYCCIEHSVLTVIPAEKITSIETDGKIHHVSFISKLGTIPFDGSDFTERNLEVFIYSVLARPLNIVLFEEE